jgi:hypothetical protein
MGMPKIYIGHAAGFEMFTAIFATLVIAAS